jgi:cyclophilin family peptidyl-prolyl cis-trans isomerase
MNQRPTRFFTVLAFAYLGACSSEVASGARDAKPAAGTPPATKTEAPAAAAAATPALAKMDEFIASQRIDKAGEWRTQLAEPPKLTFGDETYFWDLTTNKGAMKIKLFTKVAPMHASSTIYLTKLGFYDGLKFHRVIPGFMAQGGDPRGNGSGSPGYSYDGEFDPSVRHDRAGLLSMANRGPGTDGSQFFITFKATPHLNDKHTIFGEVVDGMDTVRALEKCGIDQSGRTSEPLLIEKAAIRVD